MVEFVSANPTGPLHVGHGRQAAYGATLSNILSAVGFNVAREYYINDAGRQMDILAVSTWLRYLRDLWRGAAVPRQRLSRRLRKAAWRRSCTRSVGERLRASGRSGVGETPGRRARGRQGTLYRRAHGACRELIGADGFREVLELSLDQMLADIREDLGGSASCSIAGIRSARWRQRRDRPRARAAGSAGPTLQEGGRHLVPATEFGDEKDRVVVRENGRRPISLRTSLITWKSASWDSRGSSTCSARTITAT